MFKYVLCVIFCIVCVPQISVAEVCFTDDEAVNIIALLDASERDLDYITSCDSLVKELYIKIEERDKKIINLTEELIKAKQDAIEYKASRDTWRRIVIYGGAAGAVVLIIELAPLL